MTYINVTQIESHSLFCEKIIIIMKITSSPFLFSPFSYSFSNSYSSNYPLLPPLFYALNYLKHYLFWSLFFQDVEISRTIQNFSNRHKKRTPGTKALASPRCITENEPNVEACLSKLSTIEKFFVNFL